MSEPSDDEVVDALMAEVLPHVPASAWYRAVQCGCLNYLHEGEPYLPRCRARDHGERTDWTPWM